jgi:hypothetical protein
VAPFSANASASNSSVVDTRASKHNRCPPQDRVRQGGFTPLEIAKRLAVQKEEADDKAA